MSEAFDAYHRWLGIPPKDQPPTHYRLLALEPFESDPDVIESAADRQMGHLRTYQTGRHAELSQKLLNEVAAAKLCLLNAQKRAQYDAQLRRQWAGRAEAVQGLGGAAAAPEVARPPEPPPFPGAAEPASDVAEKSGPRVGVIVGGFAAGILALVAVVALIVWPRHLAPSSAEEGPGDAQPPGGLAASPNAPQTPKPEKPPIVAPKPVQPEPGPSQQGPGPPLHPEPTGVKTPPGAPPGPGPSQVLPGPGPKEGPQPGAKVAPLSGPSPKPALQKAAVPSESEQQKARKVALEVYQKELDRATRPEDQLALARKLLGNVQQGENTPAERFVLLVMARELAEQGRDWATAVEAIDELDAGFQIDAVEVKARVLEGFAKLARSIPEHASIAREALALTEEAASKEDFLLAASLSKLAQSEALKSRSRDLQAAVRAGAKQVQEIAKAAEKVQAAREALKADPQDPAANLTVGRHLCLVRGDWTGGLPRLASCSDETLETLARKDLTQPASPEEKVAVGNGWWDVGEKEETAGQGLCRLRAAYWYHAAVDGMTQGLERERVQKRLQEAAPLEAAARVRRDGKKGPFRAYEGTWIVGFTTIGRGRRYVIEAGGDVAWGKYQGQLRWMNDSLVIDLRYGGIDRIKLAGDALEVEHFDRHSAFPSQVTWYGKGRRLQKDPTETAPRLFRPLQGLWLIEYANKTFRAYAIDAKGNVVFQSLDAKGNVVDPLDKKQGRLSVREGEVLLDFQDGNLERLERYGPNLWVEHYRPATDYPDTIWLFGLGVRK